MSYELKLFSGNANRPLADEIAQYLRLPVSDAEVTRFSDGARARETAGALETRRVGRVAGSLYNGLELPARAAYPQIGQMQAALVAAGALGAAMSGSGPTVFGVARSWEQARQIRARVARGSWECWAVRTLRGPAIRIRDNGAR